MPVDTSVYQNQPNPLGAITGVYGVLNANQQLQLGQQAQQIRQYELMQSQANDLRQTAGSMYNTGATSAQVKAAVALRAQQGGYSPNVVQPYIDRMNAPDAQSDFDTFLKNERTQAAGTGGLFSTQTVYPQVGGQARNVPAAAVPRSGAPAGNAPGFEAVAGGPGGAGGITDMQATAVNAPMQAANLDNLAALGNEAVSGPSSDFEKRANALALRLFGKGVTLTPEQLASSEEYGKIAEQIAGQQATAAHATNAFLTNAYNTNPSLYLSKIGRQGITHMLQGNLDSIVAKNNAWDSYANGQVDGQQHPPSEFGSWNRQFNANFNPRVFQYARMTPDERTKFRSTLPVGQQAQFYNQLQTYQKNGWINMGQ